MANIPKTRTLSGNSVDIINAIRNSASQNYRDYIPQATPDAESVRAIGSIIMDNPNLQNEFLSTLINRIGRVMITSRMYNNPLAVLKNGIMELGETIEEIFVNLAKPFLYDSDVAENEVFKKELPDVKSAFHTINYEEFYKVTVNDRMLRRAFVSWEGVNDLITSIIDSMYKAQNYDEFLVTKYLIALNIVKGRLYIEEIPVVTSENMKSVVSVIKGVSNDFDFLSTKYNIAGVYNNSEKDRQYILVNSKFDATMDVEVLASAFNMDKTAFYGKKILVDSFGNLDIPRLNRLFKDSPDYEVLSDDILKLLDNIPAVIIDKDFLMIFDNMIEMTENYNGQGLYWNYFLHNWKTFSVSPFQNACVFINGNPSVTSVAINPTSATITNGQKAQLNAIVETTLFAPQSVKWSIISGNDIIELSNTGVVTAKGGVSGNATVRATSTYDNTKYGECNIEVV